VLRAYPWPGNIRELKNVVERAVILSTGDTLRLDLSLPERHTGAVSARDTTPAPPAAAAFLTEREMQAQQRMNVEAALDAAGWRVSGTGGAADLLGIRPTPLTDRMKKLKIRRPAPASNENPG
jgi:transcriptional regulator with GAF, ATPase, and Fis domain